MISRPGAIETIAWLDRHRRRACFTRDAEAEPDAPRVQAPVVQPAQLAIDRLHVGQILRVQSLPGEERDALELRDVHDASICIV